MMVTSSNLDNWGYCPYNGYQLGKGLGVMKPVDNRKDKISNYPDDYIGEY